MCYFRATVWLFFLLLSFKTQAGGYYLPDRGVRAFSRGGAFTVGCDDLSALWYNPATLASQSGTQIHVDAGLIDYEMRFSRYRVEEVGQDYAPAENQAPPLPDPAIAVSSDFGLPSFTAAFGVFGPYIALSRFEEDGAQRYSLIRSDNLGYIMELALAWQPLAGIRIGAGLSMVSLMLNHTQAASSFPGLFGGPEDKDQDGIVQIVAKDEFQPQLTVGIWLRPAEWFEKDLGIELGVSVMSGVTMNAEGNLRIRLPNHWYWDDVGLDPSDPPISTTLSLPWVVRAGLRYLDPLQRFDIEANVVWEGWSCLDQIVVDTKAPVYYRNVPMIGDYLVLPLTLERQFQDTWSYRLGGSFKPLEWLVVRLGGYYETGATPKAYYSVATSDADKWALTLGLGAVVGAFEIDLGYMHIFQKDIDLPAEESLSTQTNPSNPESTTSVGGGRYQSAFNIVGLSLLVHIDRFF